MQTECNLSCAKRLVILLRIDRLLNRDVVTFLAEYNPTLVTHVTTNVINISTIVSKYFLCFLLEHRFYVNLVPELKGTVPWSEPVCSKALNEKKPGIKKL